jgi:hypothetical protein
MQGADRIGQRNKRCGEPRACATARAASQSNNPSCRASLGDQPGTDKCRDPGAHPRARCNRTVNHIRHASLQMMMGLFRARRQRLSLKPVPSAPRGEFQRSEFRRHRWNESYGRGWLARSKEQPMDLDPLLVSRLQFAFTIIWPADEHRCDVAGKSKSPGQFARVRLTPS